MWYFPQPCIANRDLWPWWPPQSATLGFINILHHHRRRRSSSWGLFAADFFNPKRERKIIKWARWQTLSPGAIAHSIVARGGDDDDEKLMNLLTGDPRWYHFFSRHDNPCSRRTICYSRDRDRERLTRIEVSPFISGLPSSIVVVVFGGVVGRPPSVTLLAVHCTRSRCLVRSFWELYRSFLAGSKEVSATENILMPYAALPLPHICTVWWILL